MRVLSILALILAGMSAAAVCIRMLVLAWRSGELPELLMGTALASLMFLAIPLSGIGRSPTLLGTPLGDGLLAAGLLFLGLGISLLSAFTCRVFRPRSLWALMLVMLQAWGSGVVWHGFMGASQGTTMEEILGNTRPWALAFVALLFATAAWTALEAGLHRAQLRRRQRLGLADPVVINRMTLWMGSGIALCVLLGAILIAIDQGIAPLRSLPFILAIGVGATAVGGCWGLAFFPPPAYLRWIGGRTPAEVDAMRPASLQ
ncbi:MAG: hypothetical protein QNK05_13155 [Myxococcota bacterium]|nr:hypothetical protein [Myxococcota bacterium]